MKNVPVVVIRNRDESIRCAYRVRDLLTNRMTYVDEVTLLNPAFIPNVDYSAGLVHEQVVACNWAITGVLAEKHDVQFLPNRVAVTTTKYGFQMPPIRGHREGHYYYEPDHGVLAGLSFGASDQRYVWFVKMPVED